MKKRISYLGEVEVPDPIMVYGLLQKVARAEEEVIATWRCLHEAERRAGLYDGWAECLAEAEADYRSASAKADHLEIPLQVYTAESDDGVTATALVLDDQAVVNVGASLSDWREVEVVYWPFRFTEGTCCPLGEFTAE